MFNVIIKQCYLKCRENMGSKNPKIVKINNGRAKLSSNCALCSNKKLGFINEKEASGIFGNIVRGTASIFG